MDFRDISKLNRWMNLISGNLLPMSSDDSSFPFFWRLNSVVGWSFVLAYLCGLIAGFFFVPGDKSLKDGMISIVIIMEVSVIIIRIYTQKRLVQELIRKLNDNLHIQDEMMQDVLTMTLKPMKTPLQFYWVVSTVAAIVWCCVPLPLTLHKNIFYYLDLQSPVVYSKEPFSVTSFVLINVVVLLNNIYLITKKVAVDMYMTHLVLLITVQHLYTSQKLVSIFREGNQLDDYEDLHKDYSKAGRTMVMALKTLCQHHISAIKLTLMLKKLLSLNFSLIYVNGVLRFCFLAVMILSVNLD
ncbi:uncharacterized protein LOC105190818 [Harpegnathos saltator]|uniref:Odorant receptor n=1 Tax=Harpegnathos saltator TaxID=610380 RepID=E2C7D6_HARSA|nr:uncharacterized protein LOC105190818 [Harpegnathos saltator]EFN76123.1 hypothetical protein EAI_08701 [Harpegnathos saltator]